eukprot:527499-Hanusia_phi.AAC.3
MREGGGEEEGGRRQEGGRREEEGRRQEAGGRQEGGGREEDLIAGVVVTAVSVDINVDEDVGVRVAVVDLIPDGLVDLMRHSHVRESWPVV